MLVLPPMVSAFTPALMEAPAGVISTPAPELAAKAWILVDINAQQVLAAKDVETKVEPASLTKLMTAYLVFEALREKRLTLEQTLPISERAFAMEGSRMFVPKGAQVPVEDLIKGMVVQSGNDATVALAEGVGGTVEAFVEKMNAKAKELGMPNSQFRNPEGLTADGHFLSVLDLATLSRRLIRDFPEHLPYYAIKNYRYPGTPPSNALNRNLLLYRDATVDGLKTGHTEAAGYNLIATAKRSTSGGGYRRLLSVVVGTKSEKARAGESAKLLNWGYDTFDLFQHNKNQDYNAEAEVWMGERNLVTIGRGGPLSVAVPKGQRKQVKTEIELPPGRIEAPIAVGQAVANIAVTVAGKPYMKIPLYAQESVAQAGFFGRMWDHIRWWWKSWG